MKPARLLAEDSMIKRFLTLALLAIGARFSHAQPSLPSSFQAKTIHSPEAADIFVRWGGKGPVVVLIHGYAENSDSWAPLAAGRRLRRPRGRKPPYPRRVRVSTTRQSRHREFRRW